MALNRGVQHGKTKQKDTINKYGFISGNTVIKPEFNPLEKDNNEKLKQLKDARNRLLRKQKEERIKLKIKTVGYIFSFFLIGLTIIKGNASVYDQQIQLNNLNEQIKTVQSDNEAMKLELIKINNIEQIKDVAINQLGMVAATKTEVIEVNLNNSNFDKKQQHQKNRSLIQKLKDKLHY